MSGIPHTPPVLDTPLAPYLLCRTAAHHACSDPENRHRTCWHLRPLLRRRRPMEPIPNERKDPTHHAADEKGDENERGRSDKIERPNRQLQTEHVRPQNEIIKRLRPLQRNEK
jgi:hypothetical protein